MELNKDLWHVKLYFWCLDICDAFSGSYSYRHRANLCQYVRVIFIWTPLVLAVNVGFWLYVFYVMFNFPATQFGVAWTGAVYLTLGSVVSLVAAYCYLDSQGYLEGVFERLRTKFAPDTSPRKKPEVKDNGGPSLAEIVKLYLVAVKQKICPIIEFSETKVQEE